MSSTRRTPAFLRFLPLLCLGLTTVFGAKKEKIPADAPPQLLTTQGGGPRWKNTRELQAYAAKGDPQACFELGVRLLESDDEIVADLAAARSLLETAAAGGVADAHFRLGKMHHDARGVPRDYARALAHYTLAARLGVPEAQHNIGAMLVSARGVKRDYIEGLAWLLVAEQSGAASDAPQKVRERLTRRPTDIRAAELRAKELIADLPNAVVRSGTTSPRGLTAPPLAAPSPVSTSPAGRPVISIPPTDPLGPIKLSPPPAPPPPLPR